ncbi:MAG TPA: hypothetical protein VLV18_01370, partial [Terriglobales bacterium]|nr:hypothetical protein [Terriglobales bacterium]
MSSQNSYATQTATDGQYLSTLSIAIAVLGIVAAIGAAKHNEPRNDESPGNSLPPPWPPPFPQQAHTQPAPYNPATTAARSPPAPKPDTSQPPRTGPSEPTTKEASNTTQPATAKSQPTNPPIQPHQPARSTAATTETQTQTPTQAPSTQLPSSTSRPETERVPPKPSSTANPSTSRPPAVVAATQAQPRPSDKKETKESPEKAESTTS